MGRPAKPTLDTKQKIAVANQAQSAASMKALATVADRNLALTLAKRQQEITPEQLNAIVFRIIGGETLGAACRHIGIDPAIVRNQCFINEEVSDRIARAYAHGQHAFVERLLDLPHDSTMDHRDKDLEFRAITWIAARVNRPMYGDKVEHKHTVVQEPVVLPIEAMVVDAEPMEDIAPPTDEE